MRDITQSFDNLLYSTLNRFSKLKWVAWLIKSEDFPSKFYALGNILRNLTFAVAFFWLMVQIAASKEFHTVIVPAAFIILYGLLYLVFWKRFWECVFGYWGEKKVQKVLEKIESTKTIHNVMIPGNTGNIDHLVFLPQGILSIETKSWMGEIDIYKQHWYKKFGKRRFMIKNPLHQVWGCEQNLRRYLKENGIDENIVLPGIVVFGFRPDKVNWYNPETKVLYRDQLKPYIEKLQKTAPGNRDEIVKAYKLIKNGSRN